MADWSSDYCRYLCRLCNLASNALTQTHPVLTRFSIGTRDIEQHGGSWRTPIAIGWVWAVILGVFILFMPESPRWLMAHDRWDEARLSIARVRGIPIDHDSVTYTFGEMAEDLKKEEAQGQGTWLECFTGKKGFQS